MQITLIGNDRYSISVSYIDSMFHISVCELVGVDDNDKVIEKQLVHKLADTLTQACAMLHKLCMKHDIPPDIKIEVGIMDSNGNSDGGQLNYVHIESNYILFGHVKQEN